MSENKKTIVVKKDTLEPVTGNKIDNTKDVKNDIADKPEVGVEPTVENKEGNVEVKTEPTFAEKSAEAAATAALASVAQANKEISMKEAEKVYFQEKKDFMLRKCKEDEVVELSVSKLYAAYLGPVYTFMVNCIPVTVYCNDKTYEYPKFIADIINRKLKAISDSNTYKEIIEDRTNQDTY